MDSFLSWHFNLSFSSPGVDLMHHPSSFPISHPKAPLGSLCYSIHHQSLPPSGSQGGVHTEQPPLWVFSPLITLHCSYFDLCVLSGELPRHPHLAHCTDSSYIDQTQASRTIHPGFQDYSPSPRPAPSAFSLPFISRKKKMGTRPTRSSW